MKTRFTTVDIRAVLTELNQRFLGMRVVNVYDIDNKTYLIRLQRPDAKAMILLESGNKLHSTDFEWPKNMMPNGFSMKLRKHLRTRRLECVKQLGIDRIVDMQFGSGEAAYHIILELYDRGNIVLTDCEYMILNILRPRTDDSQDVRFAVRERYPVDSARPPEGLVTSERLMAILLTGKEGDSLKKILIPHLVYGPAVIEHCLLKAGFAANAKLHKDFHPSQDMAQLLTALEEAENILQNVGTVPSKGYIIQKREKKASGTQDGATEDLLTYQEFHPLLLKQHDTLPYVEFDSFDKCVDEFFSKLGSQKLDVKVLQQEKQALKKLENVKKDHEKRINALQNEQDTDSVRAQLIEINLNLVDKAILIVNSALANQVDWSEMEEIVKDAQAQGDPVAGSIKQLKLATNHIVMVLKDPYDDDSVVKPMKVDIDLALSAYANARKYYDMKRGAAKKEQKTVEASSKALKSAERKTKQTLKEVQTVATINKARKTYWFEKFFWFISSENYLVIGGRDQQQNELIVKRYFTSTDLYVHADLHGASSVIIKNPSVDPVPPKTLNEAGTMAICNSAAWDAKVVTSAWWVTHSQVSKTAPSGEYLTTGSFMIRGKKNYLPPSYLIYGFGFLFKLDEESLERHKDERKVRAIDDDVMSVSESIRTESSDVTSLSEETESVLTIQDSDDECDTSSEDDSEDENENAETDAVDTAESSKTDRLRTGVNVTVKTDDDNDDDYNHVNTAAACGENLNLKSELVESEDLGLRTEDGVKEEVQTDESDDDDDDAPLFPDTSLALHHVKGGKFTLQREERSISVSSQQSRDDDPQNDPDSHQQQEIHKPNRLSAKQRRQLKKKLKEGEKPVDEEPVLEEPAPEPIQVEPIQVEPIQVQVEPKQLQVEPKQVQVEPKQVQFEDTKPKSKEPPVPDAPQLKRRQKSKLKKMKEKYKDQDEEERQLRMDILASSGAPKVDKKGKKKNKQQLQQQQLREERALNPQHKPARPRQAKQLPPGRLTLQDITVQQPTTDIEPATDVVVAQPANDDDDHGSDDEKQEETSRTTADGNVLDSLTGQPVLDDLLLFTVPVCAPYSALTNYKFKVKLLPGTAKRGKAAKTAVHMFQHDRATTQREKDLFRSLKDVDLSRNIPGKVKVAAPNLHKNQRR